MAIRKTAFHLTALPEEKEIIERLAGLLLEDHVSTALRYLALAVAGDPGALRRVAPRLKEFRARLEALEREGG